MQPIGQILAYIPADIAGCIAFVAGFAVLAMRLHQTRKAVSPRQGVEAALRSAPPSRLEAHSDWQIVASPTLKELTRAPDLQSLHMRAAAQIDAAEHAFNRLLAECAKVGCPIVAPTFEPVRELVCEPAATRRQGQSLAA